MPNNVPPDVIKGINDLKVFKEQINFSIFAAMITFITILIAASVVLLDYLFYRRTISGWDSRFARMVAVAALAVTDTLPVISLLIFKCLLSDISQTAMTVGMWMQTRYFLTVLPRIAG